MSGARVAKLQRPIPRISLTWLLAAQALVIIPHIAHLPPWVLGFWLFCAGWRIQIFRMRARFPNAWAKAGLMLAASCGVLLTRGSLIGLDAGVVLLIAAFVLKLVELRTPRDALVLIFLGFFCVVSAYLFDDSLTAAAFSILPVSALLAAMIGLQQSHLAMRPWPTLRLACVMLAQALPLMLLLFVFFPRLAPLWSMPNPNSQARTGLSDSMTPADIAELSKSAELVFSATFAGPIPPRKQLYWRALTFQQFDGRRWSQAPLAELAATPLWSNTGEKLDYDIIMQPSGQNWLFALDVARSDAGDIQQMSDFSLQRKLPVDQVLQYTVNSWPTAARDANATARSTQLSRNLQLPASGDPRSRAWALQLHKQNPSTEALVQQLLSHFNREPFVYTLRPPPVGIDSIDEFLFRTRRGFCAHYAGAMTFVLRAAGIPARVVAGYQGGELNLSGNFLTVRQFDAHAWVEYWHAGKGWISVDPTFQVAPERIEQGLEQAVESENSFLAGSPFSLLRYRNIGWLNEVRQGWDNLNYGWQRWVLGYQGAQQLQVLQRWFGRMDSQLLLLTLVGGGGLLLGGLALFMFKPWRREQDPLLRQFLRFERLLARHVLQRLPGEGPRDFALRAAAELPEQSAAISDFAKAFEAQQYAFNPPDPVMLRRALANLRRALPWCFSRN
jgi:transglutaminase-like putative cysteine protease